MGYACPVCEEPQRDATHLANHLAFTAMVHGEAHDAWLADNVPEWEQMGPAELGPRAAELAPAADYDEVFEDTVSRGPDGEGLPVDDHDHDHGRRRNPPPTGGPAVGAGETLDAEAQRVLEEARALTREMLDEETVADDGKES